MPNNELAGEMKAAASILVTAAAATENGDLMAAENVSGGEPTEPLEAGSSEPRHHALTHHKRQ